MLSSSDVRTIALFFYFSLLDEKWALVAASRVIKKLRPILEQIEAEKLKPDSRKSHWKSYAFTAHLIELCQLEWEQFQKKHPPRSPNVLNRTRWQIPGQLDLAPWIQFSRDGDKNQFLAVLWSQILKLSDEQIAMGMGISMGTVRYRVGKGLFQLGYLNKIGIGYE